MSKSAQTKVLENVRSRKQGGRFGYGVSTADRYVKAFLSKSHVERIGSVSADVLLKDAQNTLTYCNDGLVFGSEKYASGSWKSELPGHVSDALDLMDQKNVGMVFKNIVTTKSEDRDRDVLHTAGADVDPRMPLLWQHIHTLPIGKFITIDSHNDSVLKVWSMILDMNELTNDAMILVEADALRISHGFIPKQIKVRDWQKNDEDERVPGFDIYKFEIMEESVVSVPSNRDAIIELYSGSKFKSDLVKSWGKGMFDARPVQITGSSLNDSELVEGLRILGRDSLKNCGGSHKPDDKYDDEDEEEKEKLSGSGTAEGEMNEDEEDEDEPEKRVVVDEVKIGNRIEYRSNGVVITETPSPKGPRKGVYLEMKGSYEWVRNRLSRQCCDQCKTALGLSDCSAYIVATFNDKVIVEVYEWDSSSGEKYYAVKYEYNERGEPSIVLPFTEVSLASTIDLEGDDEVKLTTEQAAKMKSFARFLKQVTPHLNSDDQAELAMHGKEFDAVMVATGNKSVFSKDADTEEENPNTDETSTTDENPGVDEGKSVSEKVADAMSVLASADLSDEQKQALQMFAGN